MRSRSPNIALLAFLLAALLGLAFRGPAFAAPPAKTDGAAKKEEWKVEEERWYVLAIGGQRCGHLHVVLAKSGQEYRTTTATAMSMGRGAASVAIESGEEFVETVRGEPVQSTVRMKTGLAPTVTTFVFGGDGKARTVETRRDGKSTTTAMPSGDWLTPQAVERFVSERMKAGAKEITYRTLDLQSGVRIATISMQRSGEAKATVTVGGAQREIPVTVWETRNDLLPIAAKETYSSEGELVESVMPLGIGELRSTLSTEEEALARPAGGGPEILVKSFVQAKVPIHGARESTHLVMRVKSLQGDLPDRPSAGGQRVRRIGPGEIEVDMQADRSSEPAAGEAVDKAFRESTPLIDGDNPEVAALVAKALKGKEELPARERAEALRRFVNRHIKNKNLATAFASASEAAKTRSGDCSEHAVLLAAMLRQAGIPSRVSCGLVYADQFAGQRDVWGWHVWTQALVEGDGGKGGPAWLDYDATLPTRFDAAHISTGIGALPGGASDEMWFGSLQLLGNISIEVVGPSAKDAPDEAPPAKREKPTPHASIVP